MITCPLKSPSRDKDSSIKFNAQHIWALKDPFRDGWKSSLLAPVFFIRPKLVALHSKSHHINGFLVVCEAYRGIGAPCGHLSPYFLPPEPFSQKVFCLSAHCALSLQVCYSAENITDDAQPKSFFHVVHYLIWQHKWETQAPSFVDGTCNQWRSIDYWHHISL